ncbi:MAG: hypothetical protein GKB99_02350 [Methanocellales archaeon]|nr:hypothetical protein [Methanocellales archaeon]
MIDGYIYLQTKASLKFHNIIYIKKGRKMRLENIYEEKLFSKGTTGMLAPITIVFLSILFYQIFIGPIGNRPAPNGFFLIMFLLCLFLTINFSNLIIRMTSQFISVSYGIFKYTVLWKNISDCYLDEASTIRYGGWGIRIGRAKRRWRLVYNVMWGPRVVLSLKKGKFGEFVFSTGDPKRVIGIVKQKVG